MSRSLNDLINKLPNTLFPDVATEFLKKNVELAYITGCSSTIAPEADFKFGGTHFKVMKRTSADLMKIGLGDIDFKKENVKLVFSDQEITNDNAGLFAANLIVRVTGFNDGIVTITTLRNKYGNSLERHSIQL